MLQLGTIAAAVASAYRPDEAGQAATWVTTYLVTVGVLGALGWLGTVRAHRRGRRWAWPLAVTLLVHGTALAVTNLTITEYGGQLVPTWLGVVGLAPSIAGLVAVVLLRPERDA